MNRDDLEFRIAGYLDLPSLYMSGPTPPSRRKAKEIVDIVVEHLEMDRRAELMELLDEEERLHDAIDQARAIGDASTARVWEQSLEALCLRIERTAGRAR